MRSDRKLGAASCLSTQRWRMPASSFCDGFVAAVVGSFAHRAVSPPSWTGDYIGLRERYRIASLGAALRRGLHDWPSVARDRSCFDRTATPRARAASRAASASSACGRHDDDRDLARRSRSLQQLVSTCQPSMPGMIRSSSTTSGCSVCGALESRRRRSTASTTSKAGGGRHCRTRYRATSSSSIDEHADGPDRARLQRGQRRRAATRRSTGFDR